MAAIVGLIVTGCAQQKPAVDPIAAVAQLSTGAPLLRCRADCVAEWRGAQPHAAQLDAAGRWSELAAMVISINYQDDLTLYYLARAAEGLGYPAAALSYYRQSTHISGSTLACQHETGVCGGIVLPDVALVRIDALEGQNKRSRIQPRRQPATVAKPPSTGSKPLPAGEHTPQAPASPDSEPQQPASPISQPRDTTAPAPEQNRPAVSDPSAPVREPAPRVSPEPTRLDPVAQQYIEPPAGR